VNLPTPIPRLHEIAARGPPSRKVNSAILNRYFPAMNTRDRPASRHRLRPDEIAEFTFLHGAACGDLVQPRIGVGDSPNIKLIG